jgi:hypothetical protein
MILTRQGDITSSEPILTHILWFSNFFEFQTFYFSIFADLYVNICFNRAIFMNGLTRGRYWRQR